MTGSINPKTKLPVLFIGHGSPMNAVEQNEFTRGWNALAGEFPRPSAILSISAHWETRGTRVTVMPAPRTIHDFGGFPEELYQVLYPAPGSPDLAYGIIETLKETDVLPDEQWGLDHGTWSILKHLYPQADIPVVQLSLDYHKSPAEHYAFARKLGTLREKGVLILGSGNIVHNLRMVAWDRMNEPGFGFDWALEANETVKQLILERNHEALVDYPKLGRAVQLAVPTPDHFLPLLYVLALQQEKEEATFFNDQAVMGSLTMTGVRIG